MLTDAQVERYSRQILLPEVGGRGQERLLAARVLLAGTGPAAEAAAVLVWRAGVGALDLVGVGPALTELSPDCRAARYAEAAAAPAADVVVALGGDAAALARGRQAGRPFVLGALGAEGAAVMTLVGRPCPACVDPAWVGAPGDVPAGALAAPAALVLGALAAGEALRVLLTAPGRGRLTVLALASGAARAADLEPAAGCPACGGAA